MTHVTCRLTAKNRDQLRNPTLANRVRVMILFTSSSLWPVKKENVVAGYFIFMSDIRGRNCTGVCRGPNNGIQTFCTPRKSDVLVIVRQTVFIQDIFAGIFLLPEKKCSRKTKDRGYNFVVSDSCIWHFYNSVFTSPKIS